MDPRVTPDEQRPRAAIDAYLAIVIPPMVPQEQARRLAAYVTDWGEDHDRAVLLEFVQALSWAEDPNDGDAGLATLDRQVIAALATEVMCRYWRVEMLCDTRETDKLVGSMSATRFQLLPRAFGPAAGATKLRSMSGD